MTFKTNSGLTKVFVPSDKKISAAKMFTTFRRFIISGHSEELIFKPHAVSTRVIRNVYFMIIWVEIQLRKCQIKFEWKPLCHWLENRKLQCDWLKYMRQRVSIQIQKLSGCFAKHIWTGVATDWKNALAWRLLRHCIRTPEAITRER